MRSDPKPIHMITLIQAQSPITDANTNRINGLSLTHPFKLKAWMIRVATPKSVSTYCMFTNRMRQLLQAFSESFCNAGIQNFQSLFGKMSSNGKVSPAAISLRTISASLSHCLSVVALNWTFHFCSSSISARMRAAMLFCSTAGNFSSSVIALCNSSVICTHSIELKSVSSSF